MTIELREVAHGKFKSSDSFDGEMVTGSCEGGFFPHRRINNELILLLVIHAKDLFRDKFGPYFHNLKSGEGLSIPACSYGAHQQLVGSRSPRAESHPFYDTKG